MFMSFEFNCRTADNVELVLEGTLFWEIKDIRWEGFRRPQGGPLQVSWTDGAGPSKRYADSVFWEIEHIKHCSGK